MYSVLKPFRFSGCDFVYGDQFATEKLSTEQIRTLLVSRKITLLALDDTSLKGKYKSRSKHKILNVKEIA